MSELRPKISATEIEANFKDIIPDFDPKGALLESSRCLFCYDAPCIRACPTSIDIPQFIQQISNSDVRGAAHTIFTQNILGGSCGRACPTEVLCEGACVYNDINDKPIEIGRLQKYASDYAVANDLHFFEKGSSTGKKVAVVGAGPAGLSCAYELTKAGHDVTVFEAKEYPGGLNTDGLAGYKINTKTALAEVEYIKKIGIEIQLNTPIGEGGNPSIEQLISDFDAVFLGVGLGDTASLDIEGEDLEGCLEALDFIRPTRMESFENCPVGESVIVIGAGNTAVDVATAAVRLGAPSVSIVYRRTHKEMPAFEYEYELAKSDGVQFKWLTAPQKILGEDGKVSGLECVKLKLTPSEDGRGKLEEVPDSTHVIPCDMVVKALGQNPFAEQLSKVSGLELSHKGLVKVDEETGATSVKGLYAGGDCINGGGEVVDAVQHGKNAAFGINKFLAS